MIFIFNNKFVLVFLFSLPGNVHWSRHLILMLSLLDWYKVVGVMLIEWFGWSYHKWSFLLHSPLAIVANVFGYRVKSGIASIFLNLNSCILHIQKNSYFRVIKLIFNYMFILIIFFFNHKFVIVFHWFSFILMLLLVVFPSPGASCSLVGLIADKIQSL